MQAGVQILGSPHLYKLGRFLKKGYVVLPPQSETRDPVEMRWFYEGGKKDTPEPHPLPSDYKTGFLEGLQTRSGKIEFLPNSLKRGDPDNPGAACAPTAMYPHGKGRRVAISRAAIRSTRLLPATARLSRRRTAGAGRSTRSRITACGSMTMTIGSCG